MFKLHNWLATASPVLNNQIFIANFGKRFIASFGKIGLHASESSDLEI